VIVNNKKGIPMRKKIIIIIIIIFFVNLTVATSIYAKAIPPQIGKKHKYSSKNNQYILEVVLKGYPDNSPSKCILKKNSKIVWEKILSTTPGEVNISDNGRFVVLANWGRYDEGWFKGLTFLDKNGVIIKEVTFKNGNKNVMRSIDKTSIAANREYYMIGYEDENNLIYDIYNIATGDLLQNHKIKLGNNYQLYDMIISDNGKYIFFCIHNGKDIKILYSDINEKVFSEKEFKKNFTWNLPLLKINDNGTEFEVFLLKSKKWKKYKIF